MRFSSLLTFTDGMTTLSGMLLSVRDFPDELVRELKREALDIGRTLREVVIAKCMVGLKMKGEFLAAKGVVVKKQVPAEKSVRRGRGRETEPATPATPGAVSPSPASDVTERVYAGPPHDVRCGCGVCKTKKAGKP